MTRFAISVELKAKPGKEEEVAAFLISARPLVVAEPGTVTWFASRVDSDTFALFDAFETEAARQAHLNGQVAAALMARADELFSAPPTIRLCEVLADKLPA